MGVSIEANCQEGFLLFVLEIFTLGANNIMQVEQAFSSEKTTQKAHFSCQHSTAQQSRPVKIISQGPFNIPFVAQEKAVESCGWCSSDELVDSV